MTTPILGLHHVTAIAGDPQRNVDFYTGVLGLRLVKKTVNFDDPNTYHLYYGDGVGSPGTIMTFFPWPGVRQGVLGSGQTSATAFAVPEGSLGFWRQRLEQSLVRTRDVERFGVPALAFFDGDGQSRLHHRRDPRETRHGTSAAPLARAPSGPNHQFPAPARVDRRECRRGRLARSRPGRTWSSPTGPIPVAELRAPSRAASGGLRTSTPRVTPAADRVAPATRSRTTSTLAIPPGDRTESALSFPTAGGGE